MENVERCARWTYPILHEAKRQQIGWVSVGARGNYNFYVERVHHT